MEAFRVQVPEGQGRLMDRFMENQMETNMEDGLDAVCQGFVGGIGFGSSF